MSLFRCRAALVAAAALAASVAAMPLSAHEQSFSALEAIDAQPLSAVEMDAVHGQAYTLAVLALLSYAAKLQTTTQSPSPQTAQVVAQYTAIAAALSQVTVPTTRIAITTSSTRIVVRR